MRESERRRQEPGQSFDLDAFIARCSAVLIFALTLSLQACVSPSPSEAQASESGEREASLAALAVDNARWQAMWLVAGSQPPPDLPAALVAARMERAASALAMVAELLEGTEAESFRAAQHALFLNEETPDLLWCAAARASAALKLDEVAPLFAANLESSRPARRVASAEALYQLRGIWFESSAEAMEQLTASPPPSLEHLQNLELTKARLREYATDLYALDKARAARALSEPDPMLRVLAAGALSQVFAVSDSEEGFDPERARAALLQRLEVEDHPEPLFAIVSALVEQLGPTEICTHDARSFSAGLHARAAPASAEAGHAVRVGESEHGGVCT